MRLALAITGIVAMFSAVRLDPWGRSNVAAALFLVGAAGFIFALT